MSIYVLMRLLESAPRRYDAGLAVLTLGSLGRIYDRLVGQVQAGQRVLDIGCGTGALTLRAALIGASVKGIDINPEMLAVARERAEEAGVEERIVWEEIGVAELGREPSQSYDAVMSGLCFSELSGDEFRYAMNELRRLLKPGGSLLVVDEIRPRSTVPRLLYYLIRGLLVAVTYLFTQQTTHPMSNLAEKIQAAGFRLDSLRETRLGSLVEIVAVKA